ncbi:hypothetical protein TspCOW1_16130 [Thiohalobacter sp. COW1]|uniref:DUF2069 domain-containing protein n=1 Tax=Thiohalobacter sp. COW1 TaxID=2795687 RepID=UPI001915B7E6|nr:DUF2069 domain-containing protein [Thiohalobacter sp. COW1]BCO31510.1 hypothetical protein TspCOW1_16130 [Thiohalobacter sp. COW1]
MTPALWHRLLLAGHLGTLAILVAWYGWLSPSPQLPTALVLLVLGVPLLLPLRGLLHGRRYTAAWSLFLAIAYCAHALVELYSSPDDRLYAGIELVTTLTWFVAGIGYIRATRDEL